MDSHLALTMHADMQAKCKEQQALRAQVHVCSSSEVSIVVEKQPLQ